MTEQVSEALTGLNKEIDRLRARVARLETLRTIIPWHLASNDEFMPMILKVIDMATEAFGESEATWTWLCSPQYRFGGRSPLEAAMTGDEHQVIQLIAAIQYGVYI